MYGDIDCYYWLVERPFCFREQVGVPNIIGLSYLPQTMGPLTSRRTLQYGGFSQQKDTTAWGLNRQKDITAKGL